MKSRHIGNELLERNPFQELYLTEALTDPDLFFQWFSPAVITGQTETLFRDGNVVLQGSNGAGKTMLLRLFAPEVQAAYLRHDYDPPSTAEPTLSIGINFVHAGVGSFGARTLRSAPAQNRQVWASVFADFLNYYLIEQLTGALTYLSADEGQIFARKLGADVSEIRLNRFASLLSKKSCWFGYLDGINTLGGLRERISSRLGQLRGFINWNTESLPRQLLRTKTEIGVPLRAASALLAAAGVLPRGKPLVVTVDQYETLVHIDYEAEPDPDKSFGHTLCRVVNSLLARRDPNVHFKVGARPYSWSRELRLLDSDARLELGRDYQLVNLDEVLSRDENRAPWIFPAFARDVAARRIAFYFHDTDEGRYERWLEASLEKLPPAMELAKYTRNRGELLVPRFADWSTRWRRSLVDRGSENLYDALLQEVWMLQAVGRGELDVSILEREGLKPWERQYFRKERKEALLSQVASACRQRRLYAGWDTLLTLSGGNILVFLSLCREMWDLAQRARATNQRLLQAEFTVERQAQAIWNISASWLRKQDEFSGGAVRRRFVSRLGSALRRALMADVKLSNPGRTGFSVPDDELDRADAADVRAFLNDATDFGALVRRRHTTKERDGRPRQKWYLFPVLCPNFDLPAIRTKEPYYSTVEEVRRWIDAEETIVLRGAGDDSGDVQGQLFR